jgi:murein DD-endopeptidase MepM/ murein hydrolase activator NlpD
MATTESVSTQGVAGAADGATDTLASRGARAASGGREELKRLAQEFEATLMNEMLSGWRRSLVSDEEESGTKTGAFTDMVGAEFGRAISRSGGFGIADVLMRALQRQYGQAADNVQSATPDTALGERPAAPAATHKPVHDSHEPLLAHAVPAVERAGAPPALEGPEAGAAVRPVSGVVTSGFGWRSDPINGRPTFHSGADVRMAYGQDVPTVAAGRVTFAGDRSGYGLTVVIDHGEGLETRYAHLSSAAVGVGDYVGTGGIIARSGSSGRSTGPHLHVELLRDGRPVDPSGFATALKVEGSRADSSAYRSISALGMAMAAKGDKE